MSFNLILSCSRRSSHDLAYSRPTIAELVDVGDGTAESVYEGKDVRGKLVLAAGQPGPVSEIAVDKFGAAGIVSYAQNQRSAWWREDETLVRWGHLNTFPKPKTFAFMVSLKQARAAARTNLPRTSLPP